MHIYIHVLMRDEGRKEEASKVKHVHVRRWFMLHLRVTKHAK